MLKYIGLWTQSGVTWLPEMIGMLCFSTYGRMPGSVSGVNDATIAIACLFSTRSATAADVLLLSAWSSTLYTCTGWQATPPLALIHFAHVNRAVLPETCAAPTTPVNVPTWPITSGA